MVTDENAPYRIGWIGGGGKAKIPNLIPRASLILEERFNFYSVVTLSTLETVETLLRCRQNP